jgi:hypothetical protein
LRLTTDQVLAVVGLILVLAAGSQVLASMLHIPAALLVDMSGPAPAYELAQFLPGIGIAGGHRLGPALLAGPGTGRAVAHRAAGPGSRYAAHTALAGYQRPSTLG